MAISYLNGFDDNEDQELGKLKDKFNKLINHVTGTVKDAVQNVGQTIQNVDRNITNAVQKNLPIVAKIGLAPARLAFIGIVKLNALKLAKRLAQAYQSSPQGAQELKDLWEKKFKGKWSDLRQAINQGANTSISGSKYKAGDIVGGQVLGTDGIWHDIKKGTRVGSLAAIGTAIATATPILVAVIGLISKLKSDKQGDASQDIQAIADATKVLVSPNQNIATIETGAETTETPFYKNPMVLGIGAVAIVGGYMLMKKRK
jgi:hypothetical protein